MQSFFLRPWGLPVVFMPGRISTPRLLPDVLVRVFVFVDWLHSFSRVTLSDYLLTLSGDDARLVSSPLTYALYLA